MMVVIPSGRARLRPTPGLGRYEKRLPVACRGRNFKKENGMRESGAPRRRPAWARIPEAVDA
jgi:hypothetical protein